MQALMVETPVGSEGLLALPENEMVPLPHPFSPHTVKGGSEANFTRLSKRQLNG